MHRRVKASFPERQREKKKKAILNTNAIIYNVHSQATKHFLDRLKERHTRSPEKIYTDFVTAIALGKVRKCRKFNVYKVYGRVGRYILSNTLDLLTTYGIDINKEKVSDKKHDWIPVSKFEYTAILSYFVVESVEKKE